MWKLIVTLVLTILAAVPASAQKINMDFPGLADRADEVVDVTLDASMLKLASKFLSRNKPDEAAVRDMIAGLQGIYVRSYEFKESGAYDRALVDRILTQLGPSWKPLVTVRSKKRQNVNIMADMRGEQIHGLVIVATEPREFTVVNIVGTIDIDRLADLEGKFGIPDIDEDDED